MPFIQTMIVIGSGWRFRTRIKIIEGFRSSQIKLALEEGFKKRCSPIQTNLI